MKSNILTSLTTYHTFYMYLSESRTIAANVFEYNNLNRYIDEAYLKNTLLQNGSIAFFKDNVLGLLALPYYNIGSLDVYGRPLNIVAFSPYGNGRWCLKENEFVIMYDNNSYTSILYNIRCRVERLTLIKRIIDVNILQQRTPRFIRVSENNKLTVRNMLESIDDMEEKVLTFDSLKPNEVFDSVLTPAPIVFPQLQQQFLTEWNELLTYVGVPSLMIQKKERLIQDEVKQQSGGTLVLKNDRYTPRKKAISLINERFNQHIDINYYAFNEGELYGTIYNDNPNNM